MKRLRGLAVVTIAALAVAAGTLAHASGTPDITTPGTLAALPAAPPDTSFAPLDLSQTQATPRQALDAAEAQFGLTDGQIDPDARATPAIVSAGLNPRYHDMKAWVVTADVDLYSHGPIGAPRMVSHRLCIIVDAATGKYIMAFNAGPEDPAQ